MLNLICHNWDHMNIVLRSCWSSVLSSSMKSHGILSIVSSHDHNNHIISTKKIQRQALRWIFNDYTITVIVLPPCYKTSVGLPCSTGINKFVCLYYMNLLIISQLWKFQIISHLIIHQQESTTRSLIILQILEQIHTCTVTFLEQFP